MNHHDYIRTDKNGRMFDADGREIVAVLDGSAYMHKDVIDDIERRWDEAFGAKNEQS